MANLEQASGRIKTDRQGRVTIPNLIRQGLKTELGKEMQYLFIDGVFILCSDENKEVVTAIQNQLNQLKGDDQLCQQSKI